MNDKELKEQIEKVMYEMFCDFSSEPVGNIEGDICDWNSPRLFSDKCKTPSDVQKLICENRIPKSVKPIYDLIKQREAEAVERLAKIVRNTRQTHQLPDGTKPTKDYIQGYMKCRQDISDRLAEGEE